MLQDHDEGFAHTNIFDYDNNDDDDEDTFKYFAAFTEHLGLRTNLDSTASPLDFFDLIWGDDRCEHLVKQTNL